MEERTHGYIFEPIVIDAHWLFGSASQAPGDILQPDRDWRPKKPGLPVSKYRADQSPKWRGGRHAKNLRRRYMRSRLRQCIDCAVAFYAKKGSGSARLCAACIRITSMCELCHKDFQVTRACWKRGRGRFCSLACANVHFTLTDKRLSGPQHHFWKDGSSLDQLSYRRDQRAKNRSRFAFYARHRAYLKKGAQGTHTIEQWEALKLKYNYRCVCCQRGEPDIKLTEDHKTPISKGGSNDIDNIQPLCVSCNSRKHTKSVDYTHQI